MMELIQFFVLVLNDLKYNLIKNIIYGNDIEKIE